MSSSPVERVRVVGQLEGLSFLLLLGVAMPLKYIAGIPTAVLVVGWAHGVLFIAYLAVVAHAALVDRWPPAKVLAALVASVVPFGPYIFDARFLRSGRDASGTTRE